MRSLPIARPVRRLVSLLTSLSFALILVSMAAGAHAQGIAVNKEAGGPFVQPSPVGGNPTIEAGRTIEWTITIPNPSPQPGIFGFLDVPSQNECGTATPQPEDAPNGLMVLEDTNLDGNCNEAVTSIENGGTAWTVTCDPATNELRITNIQIAPFALGANACRVNFTTRLLDDPGSYSQTTCNWGHLLNPSTGEVVQDTTPPGGATPGCSCLTISPPSGFDFRAEKTAVIDNGRLIPGDPSSTVTYTIRAINTGSQDIPFGSLLDILPPGAEWIDPAVSCPPPLTCTFSSSRGGVLDQLDVSGYNLPSTDPDSEISIVVRAQVTCEAATDDDSFVLCNQGEFTINAATFPTDDPGLPSSGDATCVPVVWSNLTGTTKIFDRYDDTNTNGLLDVGERVHFIIQARNTGRYTSTDVEVTDNLAADGCFDPASVQALDGGVVAGGVVTWTIPTLVANGGQATLRCSAVLSANQICCNQATLNSAERIGCNQGPIVSNDPSTAPPADPTCVAPGPRPDLDFLKSVTLENDVDGDTVLSDGDFVRWRITIENVGAAAATGATLNDPLPLCLRGFSGTLTTLTTTDGADAGTDASTPAAPPLDPGTVRVNNLGGANGIVPGEVIVVEFIASAATVTLCCNQAQITYAEAVSPALSDDAATPGVADDPTCVTPPPAAPRAELEKTARVLDTNGDGFLAVGERVEYTLVFRNIGSETLSTAQVVDASQACITLDISTVTITTSPAGIATTDSSSGTTVTVDITSIDPTESVTIVFEGVVNAVGSCCNQASYTATGSTTGISGVSDVDPNDFVPDQPTCHVGENVPSDTINMSITKTAAETGCQDPGGTINYTITVTATGTDDVPAFRVEDVLDGTMYGDLPIVDLPLGVTQADRTGDGVEDYIVAFDDPTLLAVGNSRVYTYRVQLGCSDSGSATNSASVTFTGSTGSSQTRTDTVTSTWGIPDLSTTKTRTWADADTDGFVDLGEVITYTVTVTNAASATCAARDVSVSDPLDGSLSGASVNALDGGSYDGGSNSVLWDAVGTPALLSIAPGASVVVRFEVQLSASATPGATITNTAAASPKNAFLGNCPPRDLSASGAAPTVQYDPNVVLPTLTLLRNDFVSCRLTAFTTVRAPGNEVLFSRVGACSNPSRINTAHPQTDSIATPAMPYTAVGDAMPGTDGCPQIGAGDGRVLIFYELSESSCTGPIPNLQVDKSGNDVILSW